ECIPFSASDGWFATKPEQIIESKANQVVINTERDNGKCLVLADSYFPGWRAYIRPQGAGDDQEQEVTVKIFYNFRVVYLPAGAWTVRYRYTPPSVQIGAFTSFMAVVVAIFMVLVWGWRRYYTEDESEQGEFRRLAKNS